MAYNAPMPTESPGVGMTWMPVMNPATGGYASYRAVPTSSMQDDPNTPRVSFSYANGSAIQGSGVVSSGTDALAQQAKDRATWLAGQPGLPQSAYDNAPSQQNQSASTRSMISQTSQPGFIKGYDTQNNYAPVYVPAGKYVQGISLYPQRSEKVTPSKLTPEKPIDVSGTTGTAGVTGGTGGTSGSTGTTGGSPAANVAFSTVQADVERWKANYEATKTAEQKKAEGLSTDIASLLGQETGKSAFISEQRHLKEDQLNKDLTNVQNQLKSIDAQQVQARLDAEGQPMTLSRLTGEKARQDALFNSQKLTLSAQANMLMGNISLAENQIQQATEEKYGPIEETIRIKEGQLQALQPILTKQEKIQADALQANYDAQKLAVANQKQLENEQTQTVLNFAKNYPDAGITLTDNLSQAQAKLKTSKIYQTELAQSNLKNQLTQSEISKNLAQAAKDRIVSPGSTYAPGANSVVDSWAERIQSGQAKITDIPAKEAGLRNQVTVALSAMGNTMEGKPTVTEMGKAALATAKTLLNKFTKGEGTSAVGKSAFLGSFGYGLIPGTARANFVSDFNSLKSQLSLEGVKFLKGQGQVSDAERALLAQAVTKLNLSQSEPEFKTTLEGIISKLSGNSQTIQVTDPAGGVHAFSDQASADAFKKAAGIK